jgi:hypothetical protein
MPIYHDEELVKKVWELKQKNPDWGVRRIGQVLKISKDKAHRILKRIKKGEIEVTSKGKIIDKSEPKGVVAHQQTARQALEPTQTFDESIITQEKSETLAEQQDPLEALLKAPWNLECDKCRNRFEYNFTDEETRILIENGYTYIDCTQCKDYPLGDIFGAFPYNHRIFIHLADFFRAYLNRSKLIRPSKGQ